MSGPGVDALIFDLDGTLADTLDDIGDALNRVLAARGFPVHTRAAYRDMIGSGALNLVRAALPEHAQAHAPVVLDEYRRDYATHLLVKSAPYPGIPELLAELQRRALPMCVLSNKADAMTREVVARLFPAVQFAAVAGERPERPRKPDPEVALELCARMGVAPARAGFVGDTAIDIQTARAAGMRSFGVTWGFRDAGELRAAGADALVDRPEQLLPFVRQLPSGDD